MKKFSNDDKLTFILVGTGISLFVQGVDLVSRAFLMWRTRKLFKNIK